MTRIWPTLLTVAAALWACGGSLPITPANPLAENPESKPPSALDPRTPQTPSRPETRRPELEREPEKEPEWPELQTSVPLYALEIAPADLEALEARIDDHDFHVPAIFRFEGRTWRATAGYRGHSTRYLPKRSFQIKFPAEDPFHGEVKTLELLAEWKDGGLLTQKVFLDLAASVGVRAPTAQFVNLEINGRFHGVMVQIEAIKKTFLAAHGYDRNSDIYRCGQRDCELRDFAPDAHQQAWQKRTNEDEPWDGLWEMIHAISRSAPSALTPWLEENFELDEYLTWLAVDAALSNYAVEDSRSYFVFDRETRRWGFVPWDLNNSLALLNRTNGVDQGVNSSRPLMCFSAYDPLVYDRWSRHKDTRPELKPTWNTLNTRIYDDPALRGRLIERIRTLAETRFRSEELAPRIAHLAQLLKPHLARDPWVDPALVEKSGEHLTRYVAARRTWLLDNLHKLENHGRTALKIDRVGVDAGGRTFIELHNGGTSAVNLSGYFLTAFLRAPQQAKLGALRVGPGDVLRLMADEVPGLIVDLTRPEFGLFAPDGVTAVDLVYLPPLSPGQTHGRVPRGSESFGAIP